VSFRAGESTRAFIFVGGTLLALTLACALGAARGPALGARVELVVLGTTDVHGRLVPWDYFSGRESELGLVRVATLVDSIRAAEPNVLLFDSGDLLQGNPLTYYYGVVAPADTHPVVLAMNHLRYDAAAIGNHEFDYGLEALDRAFEDAAFPLLAGNVFVAGTDSLAFPAWTLVERAGVRVAILGFTTPGTAIWNRHHVAGRLEFRDIVASARRAWPEADAASDIQIAVVHSGMGPGSSYDEAATGVPPEDAGADLAEALPGLELVLIGHTHRAVPADTVNGVILAQAGRWAEALVVARLELAREAAGWRVVGRGSTLLSTADAPADTTLLRTLGPYHERVLSYVADTIGWTPEVWSAARARVVDTPIIDLIQRVQLDATGADLSAASAFNTEARFGPGPITRADAAALYLYENTLRAIRITGRQLRDYLEYSARYFHQLAPDDAAHLSETNLFVDSIPGYNYDMVEGVEYVIDLTRPIGKRIVELTHRGAPVRDDQSFTLAINSYRANGGGGYSMIQDAPVVYDRNEEIRDLLIRSIEHHDSVRQADVFRPSWKLLPGSMIDADSARLREIAEREMGRIAGDARARVARAGFLPDLPPAREGPDTVRVAFVATNDFHGALLPAAPSWAGGDTVGGAATLASYVTAIEARYPEAVVWLDGGDLMQGTLISNLTYGRSTVEVMNAIGLDAAAIGNHEFDWSVDTLRARIADAAFPWLSANIFEKASGKRPAWAVPYVWMERAGLRIAVIGASTVATPVTTMPANVAAYEFRDIASVVDELAPELLAEGADLIVLTVHAGAAADSAGVYRGEIVEAARRITAPLDLIVSGHTHTHVETVENGIPIVQARSSGTALGIVVLTYVPGEDEVVDHDAEIVTTYAKNVTPDSAVAAIVERHRQAVSAIAERPIATMAHPIVRERAQENALGSLIADAQRWAAGTQVAAINAGGIRSDFDEGPVTYEEVFRVHPFQNLLVRLRLTGEQLRWALEAAVANRLGQVSGVRYAFDPTRPAGERVREATLADETPVVRDGRAVDPQATYTMTMNNFMVERGDTYGMIPGEFEAENTGLVDTDVLAEYLQRLPQPIRYEVPGRVTQLAPWPPEEE
jgi:2',3'-cyclic-nucleotide 2'-phosphodiesterase/3'-nucleotidase/5'-nucleotidase